MKSGKTPSLTATVTAHRRQAQAFDSQALDYLSDGIFTCQLLAGDLTVAYGNRAFKERVGLSAQERLEGRSLSSLIGGLLSKEVLETLRRAVTVRQRLILMLPTEARAGERRFRLELRPVSGNGGANWVGSLSLADAAAPLELKSAALLASGRPREASDTGTVGASTRGILDAAPGLIGLRDVDGRFRFVNSTLAEFLGLESSDVVGRRWSELVAGQDQRAAMRLPEQGLLESGRSIVERDVALSDTLGRERRFDVTHRLVSPAPGTKGNAPKQILSVATERFELASQESRINIAPQELQETAVQLAQELEHARSELKAIAERVPGAIVQWSIGKNGERLGFISRGAQLLTGYRSVDIIDEPELLFSGTDRDSRAAFRRAIEKSQRDLSPFVLDFPVRHRNSEQRKWLRLAAAPRSVSHDEVLLDGLLSDVTELKHQEHIVLAARNQLHTVTSAVPGVVYQIRFSLDGRERAYLFVSDGSRELFGAEPQVCVRNGSLFEDSVFEADVERVNESLELAIHNVSPWDLEFRVTDVRGDLRWIRAVATPGEALDDSVVFSGIITDTTQAHRAAARLEASQRQLRDITRTIPGAVFQCVARDALELSFISEGATELFGVEPNELTGRLENLLAFRRDGSCRETARRLLTLSRALEPWREEFEILTSDGDSRWLKITAQPVRGGDGGTVYHGVITDASEAKVAELRLAEGEQRLELALENGGLGLVDWTIPSGRAIYNTELARMLGYSTEELGSSINWLHDLEHPRDSLRKQKELQAHLDGATQDFNCAYRLRTKSGEWRWVSAEGRVVERGSNRGALRYVGTIKDVTDRMVAERRLEQQVVFSRLITKISSDLMKLETGELDRALSDSLRTLARFLGAKQSYICENPGGGCMVVRAADADSMSDLGRVDRPGCGSGGWAWLQKQATKREFVQARDVRDLPEEAASEREDFLRRGVASFLMVPLSIRSQSLGWLGFEFTESGRSWGDGELNLFCLLGETVSQTLSRARGERRLQAAEAQVHDITRAVPGVVAQAYRSPEGRFKFRYLSGKGLTQGTVEAALADPRVLLDRVDERDRRELERSLARAAADLTPWELDYRTRNKAGEVVWVTACAYPTRTPDGGTLFNGIATNITDKKDVEEALRRSEERFRALYDSTPVMMHSTDAEGQIVNVNREWLSTLGYAPTDVIGRRTEDFLTRASGITLNLDLQNLQASEESRDVACKMIRKDGGLIDVVLSIRPERKQGRFIGASVSIENVTQRNEAQRALEESEERYRAVVRDQTDVICRFDREGALQFANEPCTRFLGHDPADLGGRSWYEWIEPAYRERVKKRLEALSADATLAQVELRMAETGRPWYQWTVRGFFSERGELTGYQAVGRDIQELKTLETEIREISHREQKRIGHDLHDGLGQELTGISLMLKTLEQAISSQAPGLQSRVRAVRDMVGQSVATTRALAQGLSPVHLERDGFAGALSQLAANTESVYGTPVRFAAERNAPIADPSVTTDLYRIAQEALSNAARHARASQITVKLSIDAEVLKLEVSDDGRGIATGDSQTGGMGVKIMRYRASMIDASLDIVPRDGGGTVVRCTLPQLAEAQH